MTFVNKNIKQNNEYLFKNKLTNIIYLCYIQNNIQPQTITKNTKRLSIFLDKMPCKDGQYIELNNQLFKLNYFETKESKIIYYFENDSI